MPDQQNLPKPVSRDCVRCDMPLNTEFKGGLTQERQEPGITTMAPKVVYLHATDQTCIDSLKNQCLKLKAAICALINGMDKTSYEEARRRLEKLNFKLIEGNPPDGKQPVK